MQVTVEDVLKRLDDAIGKMSATNEHRQTLNLAGQMIAQMALQLARYQMAEQEEHLQTAAPVVTLTDA